MAEEASVAVALRIRPLLAKERAENCNICITTLPDSRQVVLGADKHFSFDHVFDPSSTQEAVYAATIQPLLDAVFQGYNATAFAYGQTGSGKSFTMGTGTAFDDASQGIIPRVICDMFERVEHDKRERHCQFDVHVSYLEIYNDALRDLLHPSTPSKAINIREDEEGGIVLAGVKTLHVRSMPELLALVQHGTACRATASTLMNDTSSRSHSILTLHLHRQEGDTVTGVCQRGKFHLVDLAGSERNKRTGNVGIRFKESVGINAGLLALGNVISVLSDERRRPGSHVPYRDSKLTRLLQDSLGGNSRTVMLACISPADLNFEETLSTLKYAARTRNIKNTPVVNRVSLAALREKQLEMYFGSPPLDEPQGADTQYVQQLEQEVVCYQQQLRTTEEALRRAQLDLQRDEEIFDEKLREFKVQKKTAKDLARRNEALAADLRHAIAHALQPLLPCSDPNCVVRAARGDGPAAWVEGLKAAHDCLRKQSADLATSHEEEDQVEVFSNADGDGPEPLPPTAEDPAVAVEMDRMKEEAMAEVREMEESFEAFKRQLLQEIKSLTIHNQLKEQLICELLKTESTAMHRSQLCEAKVQGLESSIAHLQHHIRRLKAELESSEQDSAAKEAVKRDALAKLRRAERELGQLKEQHSSQSEQMVRRIQNLERQAKAQAKAQAGGQRRNRDKVTHDWLEKEIEQCLRNKEQAERLDRELKKRERLLREREILLQQREALEKRRSSAAKSTRSSGRGSAATRRNSPPAEVSSPLILSDEEERTLLELQEESESKEEMLIFVDRVIEEARRELFGADTTELDASVTPADLKRLASQKLREKFQQSLRVLSGAEEAKAVCLQYMTKVVGLKEADRVNRRRIAQLEALLAEQRQQAAEVGRELQALTEEYSRLQEDVHHSREETERLQLESSSALTQDMEYYKNANRMLKGRLREVLLEYNEQRAIAERDKEMIDDLRQQKVLLQDQLANLKAHLHNWSHIREQRVDPSKLRPLPVEVLQERRERSLNSSVASSIAEQPVPVLSTPFRTAGKSEGPVPVPAGSPALRTSPVADAPKSSSSVLFSNSDSLLDLLRGFEASKGQAPSRSTKPPSTPPITVGDLIDPTSQVRSSSPEGLSVRPPAKRGEWSSNSEENSATGDRAMTFASLPSMVSAGPSSVGSISTLQSPSPGGWTDDSPLSLNPCTMSGGGGPGGGARTARRRPG